MLLVMQWKKGLVLIVIGLLYKRKVCESNASLPIDGSTCNTLLEQGKDTLLRCEKGSLPFSAIGRDIIYICSPK